jgi:hypothetical protein
MMEELWQDLAKQTSQAISREELYEEVDTDLYDEEDDRL